MMKSFSERLKKLRLENSWTQQDLADKLSDIKNGMNLKKQTISSYENGVEPNICMLNNIAKVFNVTVDYLTGNSECRNDTQKSLNRILSEKLEIPSGSLNDLTYLLDQYFDIVKLLFHPFLPYGMHDQCNYSNLNELTKKLEVCILCLRDYMFQSVEDINIQNQLVGAIANCNNDLVSLLENTLKKRRNNTFYFLRLNQSLNNFISSIQNEHKMLLENITTEVLPNNPESNT